MGKRKSAAITVGREPAPTLASAPASGPAQIRPPWLKPVGYSLMFLLALIAGLFFGRALPRTAPVMDTASHALRTAKLLKPGPWGNLEFTPITIAAPDEILPVRALETQGTHWRFDNVSREQVVELFGKLDLPATLRDRLLSPAMLHPLTNGFVITPTPDAVFALPPSARLALYQVLGRFPNNIRDAYCLSVKSFEKQFQSSGLPAETVERFRKLAAPYGNYLFFVDLPAMFTTMTNYNDKARLLKALTRHDTMLLRLRVMPDSDINALNTYWGKACWNTDVRALLDSLQRVPGGASLDIIELLPPLPTSLLYTFPVPQNPYNGPVATRDCHWTSFNFFREPADDHYGEPEYAVEHLKVDYIPVASDPRFGDIVLFTVPNGNAIHSAVYIADDVVYTKNGNSPLYPWVFATVSDLLDLYSFHVQAGEKLGVKYFRNKYY
jgi:hypothetical protein